MEILEKIKMLMENLSVDTAKAYTKGNKEAGKRARKYSMDMIRLLKELREDILEQRKK